MNASKNLAKNIHTLRQARNLTQQELARVSGLPRSTVSYMESGEGNPSLKNLVRVSAALQVSLEELLAQPRSGCEWVPASKVPTQARSGGEVIIHKLLPDAIPGMEIDRLELRSGARIGGIPHLPNTKEYLTCIEGRTTVFVAGEEYQLETGDVLAFPGNQPHSYLNSTESRASCLSVVVLTPTGFA